LRSDIPSSPARHVFVTERLGLMMFRQARAVTDSRRNRGNFHSTGDIRSVPASRAIVGGPPRHPD
jgi:hypothetical protein